MLGFTSGAIRIDSYQEQHQLPLAGPEVELYFQKKKEYVYNNEESEVEEADNNWKENLPDSEEDNEHEDCSDGGASECSETDKDDLGIVQTEKELENMDWEWFYSTRELVQKGNSNAKTVNELPEYGTDEGLSMVKGNPGWKKRLVIYKVII
jgi:hypothetical protein